MRYIASLEKYPITWEVVADSDEEAAEIAYEYEDAVACDTGELEQSIIKSIIPDKVNKDW